MHTQALLGTVPPFSLILSIPCATGLRQQDSPCPGKSHPQCLATSESGHSPGSDKTCQSHQSQTHLSIPLPKQELGSPEEIWLKAFRRLLQLCSAKADSSFPWEGPSPSPSDAQQGSKLLHCTPQLRAHQWGLLLSPGKVASSGHWHCCQVTPAGNAGSGTSGRAGACAQEGGELTGLIFSRLRLALTCDPRYRKDAANASSPGAA